MCYFSLLWWCFDEKWGENRTNEFRILVLVDRKKMTIEERKIILDFIKILSVVIQIISVLIQILSVLIEIISVLIEILFDFIRIIFAFILTKLDFILRIRLDTKFATYKNVFSSPLALRYDRKSVFLSLKPQ